MTELTITQAEKEHGHLEDTRLAMAVRAVREDVISFEEARSRYLLSRREFDQWERETGGNVYAIRSLEEA